MKDFLFDFVDFRNYGTASQADINRFYIRLTENEAASSNYFSNLSSQTYRNLRFEMQRRTRAFAGRLTRFQLENSFGDYLELYREINKEQYRQGYDTLSEYIDDISTPLRLSESETIQLWDNFALYLFVHPDEALVEHISTILIANLFFNRYMEFQRDDALSIDENTELQRIARHGKLLLDLPITTPDSTVSNSLRSLSINQKNLLKEAHSEILNTTRKKALSALALKLSENNARLLGESKAAILRDRDENVAALASRIEDLSLKICDSQIPELVNEFQPVIEAAVSREELVATLDPEEVTLVNDVDDTADADIPILLAKVSAASNTIKTSRRIKTESKNTVNVGDALVTIEEQLPDQAWIIQSESSSDGTSHIYWTYYHAKDEALMVENIEGSIRAGNTVIEFNTAVADESEDGFQQFRLTSVPVTLGTGSLVGDIDITVTRLLSGERVEQPSFRALLTRPAFGLISAQEDEPTQILDLKSHFGVDNIKVADFRRVEQEISCYTAGEVSHIENILASEYKERSSRKLISTEVETETTEEFVSETASDTETTDKLEMQSEASETINEEKSSAFNANTSVSGTIGAVSFTVGGSADFSKSTSQEESNSQALSYSKGITKKISKKIIEKRTRKRRTLTKREFEDINKHGFDNREGNDHVVGIYRWVDKIYENTLINYGKRLTVDFLVPEPGVHHIWSEIFKAAAALGKQKKLMEPTPPEELGIESPFDITREDYLDFAGHYGAEVNKAPSQEIKVSRAFAFEIRESGEIKTDHGASHNDFEIPEGYYAVKAAASGGFDKHGGKDGSSLLRITVGDGSMPFIKNVHGDYVINRETAGVYGIEGILPVSINANDVGQYAFTVTVACYLKDEFYKQWQLDTYNRILEAYNDQLAEYDNEKEIQEGGFGKKKGRRNPLKNKEIIKRDLKLSCINLLTVPFGIGISEQHYLVDHLPPHIIQGPKLEEHGRLIKFLENAIEWELMAYTLYPYYYNHEKLWFLKMNIEGGNDPIFENFLQSGMAELRIPIRKGYETAFLYFIETGEIWQAPKFILGFTSNAHVSIDTELATAEEEITVEETWKTKLPTNLTILQRNAGGLDETGLPCHDADEVIGVGPSVLSGTDTPAVDDL